MTTLAGLDYTMSCTKTGQTVEMTRASASGLSGDDERLDKIQKAVQAKIDRIASKSKPSRALGWLDEAIRTIIQNSAYDAAKEEFGEIWGGGTRDVTVTIERSYA
jgi:hypothetical protein